jgi:NAD+ synthase
LYNKTFFNCTLAPFGDDYLSDAKRKRSMQTQAVIDHIVHWLTDYLDQSGLKGFVAGVSGGIDSAVTSTLCALTGKPVKALNMPIHQAPDQVSRAASHIAWLADRYRNVEGVTVDLTPVFESLQRVLPVNVQDDLSMANSRSRLRMVTLYSFSTHHRFLVAGTGNKVEDFGVGFYTKYGDGGVDLSPIADLMKSEVYALAKTLGIIDAIIQAPPTDGLWSDNRSDESQIGASYDELEWAMTFTAASGDETTLDARQRDVLAIFRKFNRINRHKMLPIPVCQIPAHIKLE